MRHYFTVFVFLLFTGFQVLAEKDIRYVDSINRLGYVYVSNHLDECRQLYKKNVELCEQLGYAKGKAESLSNLGVVACLAGDYESGVKSFMEATKIYEALKMYKALAMTYADIGFRIRYIDLKRSVRYFHLAIEISEKYKVKTGTHSIYNNFGEVMKQIDYDSALFYYHKGLIQCKRENDKVGIPFSLNNLAEEYARRKQFKLAFSYLNESDSYRFKSDDKYGWADNWAYRGDIFYEMPKVDSAIFYYEKCLSLANPNHFYALQRYCSERLSKLYRMAGNYEKALQYFENLKTLEDSSLNAGVKNQLANLQVEFETEKTQRELAEHKAQLAQNELKLETRKRWIYIGSGFIILILILFGFIYRYQRHKRKNEREQLELQSKLESAEMEKEFADEKIRIARELHDNIGSHLTFMISSLDNLSYTENPQQRIDKILDLTAFGRQTMKDLRDTIWAMNHDGGSFDQLVARISELRSVIPSTLDIKLRSEVDDQLPLTGLQLLNCYRIVQEFLQNTIKYAEATQINISFHQTERSFELRLSDNGKGFDPEKAALGNGLLNMKRRCEDLAGEFLLRSGAGGTEAICKIPV